MSDLLPTGVWETSDTQGTGTYDLDGAVTDYRTFVAGVGTGNQVAYIARQGTTWEAGVGTVTDASPDTLSRDEIVMTSNGDQNPISWGGGTRDVFVGVPGELLGLNRDNLSGLTNFQTARTNLGVPGLLTNNVFTGRNQFDEVEATRQTLTDAASISWDSDSGQWATVTLGGNRTLANITNLRAGATYVLWVNQDATGSRTLAYGAAYRFPNGVEPVLSTDPNAIDILVFACYGGTSIDFIGIVRDVQ